MSAQNSLDGIFSLGFTVSIEFYSQSYIECILSLSSLARLSINMVFLSIASGKASSTIINSC